MCDEVDEQNKKKLLSMSTENTEIFLVEATGMEQYKEMLKNPNISATTAALYKFLIPRIFEDLDKIIYLDGDILILKSLENIWATDISDVYAAVGCERTSGKDGEPPIVCTRIGLDNPRYFNSGFMLLNLCKMREDGIPDKLIDYKLNGKTYNMDQDALNAVIGHNVTYFDYNTQLLYHQLVAEELREKYGKGSDRALIKKCTVLHFTSRKKPWKIRMPIVTKLYLKYYNQTPYKDEKIKFTPIKDRLYENFYYKGGEGWLYRLLHGKK